MEYLILNPSMYTAMSVATAKRVLLSGGALPHLECSASVAECLRSINVRQLNNDNDVPEHLRCIFELRFEANDIVEGVMSDSHYSIHGFLGGESIGIDCVAKVHVLLTGRNLEDAKDLQDVCFKRHIPMYFFDTFPNYVSGNVALCMKDGLVEATAQWPDNAFSSGDVDRLPGWASLAIKMQNGLPILEGCTMHEKALLADILKTKGVVNELQGLGWNITESIRHIDEAEVVSDRYRLSVEAAKVLLELVAIGPLSINALPQDIYALLKLELKDRINAYGVIDQ